MLSESKIIADLKSWFPEYIGDDAAVFDCGSSTQKQADKCRLVTKDILVEDIHFRTSYYDASSLAYKALRSNLSDIAAMGGTPEFVLLGIAIPVAHEKYAQKFLQSFAYKCDDAGVVIVGGDTTRSADKLFISVTVIGSAPSANIKRRKDAKVGDLICVVGNLGYAHLGLVTCERALDGFDEYKDEFLRPMGKIGEGAWLGKQVGVHAMMDISDGLFIDLERLCEASNVQACLELEQLHPHRKFRAACRAVGLDALDTALTGGEDYGLLFTVAPQSYASLANYFARNFGYEIKCVGVVTSGQGVSFIEQGMPKVICLKPFKHFG